MNRLFQLQQHYEMHSDQIYQFLYFDVQLSEDLMQETFIRAYEAKHTYRGESNVLTWLRTIAKNSVYDHFKRKKIITFLPFTKNDAETAITLSAEQLISIEEDKRELYKAIASLKLEHRLAIILRKVEGLSIKETAAILGWNEAKVKNNTERGMKALEKMLKGGSEDGQKATSITSTEAIK